MTNLERAALDAQRRMLGETAHELRTPLAVIMGHAELLTEGLQGEAAVSSARAILAAAENINEALQRRVSEVRAALLEAEE